MKYAKFSPEIAAWECYFIEGLTLSLIGDSRSQPSLFFLVLEKPFECGAFDSKLCFFSRRVLGLFAGSFRDFMFFAENS